MPTALREASPEKVSSASDRRLQDRLQDSARRARRYFESARAPATVRAYASDLADFETWCKIEAGGLSTLPATTETVALYIADAGAGPIRCIAPAIYKERAFM